jgi:peptidoglycan/xylan/chitin deacetylase (PgdA/CDA1 family)
MVAHTRFCAACKCGCSLRMSASLFGRIAPGGQRARLSILIFHRVLAQPDELFPGEIDAGQFERICQWIQPWFHVLPLRVAVDLLYRGELPPRSLAITFDDGYADNEAVAAPILSKYNLPATFFVASGYLDGAWMWNDGIIDAVRRCTLDALDLRGLHVGVDELRLGTVASRQAAISALLMRLKYLAPLERHETACRIAQRAHVEPATDLMLTSSQLQRLSRQGFDVGAHTVTHPIMATLSPQQARHEIESGRDRLQAIVGQPILLFAYPNGKPNTDFNAMTVRLVRDAGFEAAVTTAWGVSTPASDRFQLARFTPWDRTRIRFGARLARNCFARPLQCLAEPTAVV